MKQYLKTFIMIFLMMFLFVGCAPTEDEIEEYNFEPAIEVLSGVLPTSITSRESLTFPQSLTVGSHQVTLTWVSNDETILLSNGTVVAQPGFTGSVPITITLTYGTQVKEVIHTVNVTIEELEERDIEADFIYIFEELSNNIPQTVEVVGTILLPSLIDDIDANIAWISSNTRRITDQGEVLVIGETDTNVTLTAVVTIDDEVRQQNFVVKILADKEYLFTVAEEYLQYNLKNSTNRDYRLYYTYPNYPSVVTYVSSHPDVLANDGKYTKAEFDTLVELTVFVTIRNETRSFVKEVFVIGPTDQEKVQAIGEWAVDFITNTTQSSVTELPTTHPQHKGIIEWFSNDVGVIEKNRLLIQPISSRTVHISINIRVNFQTLSINYDLLQAGNPNLTEEQLLDEWIDRNLYNEIDTVYNLFDGKGIEVRQALLDPSAPYYSNLTPGLMREVPQSTLDSLFYPGYQMPNEDNILWIVIHETGNRNNGTGALVHSNLQVNRSMNGFGSDATASWHYTVDDKFVYQNIPDNRRAWHAGDGSGAGTGNSNGIGIEMAINADGNYEASLRNNAKLVAQLMYRYHLTFENVRQHNYFSSYGKNCPEIMRNTNRWFEFLDMIAFEYRAIELLDGATVSWTLETNTYVSSWHSDTTLLYIQNRPTTNQVVDLTLVITKDSFNKEYNIPLTVKSS